MYIFLYLNSSIQFMHGFCKLQGCASLTFTLSVLTGSLSKDTVRGKMTSSLRTTGSSTGDYITKQRSATLQEAKHRNYKHYPASYKLHLAEVCIQGCDYIDRKANTKPC